MTPKHRLSQAGSADQQLAKRAKSSQTPASRSATPAELDLSGKVPFEVHYPAKTPSSKKKLRKDKLAFNEELLKIAETQVSPFVTGGAAKPGELDQEYAVTPNKDWEAMKKYSNFIISGDVYKNNQFVYVRGESTPQDNGENKDHDFWVARILQVRAKNAQHVYALVAWMYWPEELPAASGNPPDVVRKESGQRKYHGMNELVASNYMEVLDVLSFAGKADVSHWREENEHTATKLYWRQTFCRETQELSKIREHCTCGGHFNVDKPMYICDNPECGLWLHKDCIIEDALMKSHKELIEDAGNDTNGVSNSKKGKGKKPFIGKFSGKLVEDDPSSVMVEITDIRSGKGRKTWQEKASCLKCGTVIQR